MLNIISYKGNANQNHKRYHPIPVRTAKIQHMERQQMLQRMWKNRGHVVDGDAISAITTVNSVI